MSELRWNPLMEEWVVTATHRQDRTFFPPKDYCPLCPSTPGGFPTDIPASEYDIAVFENKFPSFQRQPPAPDVAPTSLYQVSPALGICEVVVFTSKHDSALKDLGVRRLERLIEVWTDRYVELGARPSIDYVFIFENKGKEIGVTLNHPHGQIYAFSYVPPRIERELEACRKHMKITGHCLLCDVLAEEYSDGRRVVFENESFYAGVPFYARFPYEVHILSRHHLGSLADFDRSERRDLAVTLKNVLVAYDALFDVSFPYMLVMHQTPTDGNSYPHYHFHIELYPPYRTKERLKFLAGCESGAGTFINDTLPEEKAPELRVALARGMSRVPASELTFED